MVSVSFGSFGAELEQPPELSRAERRRRADRDRSVVIGLACQAGAALIHEEPRVPDDGTNPFRLHQSAGNGAAPLRRASFRKQPVTDVARGGRQSQPSRLAPLRPVDLTLVSDLQSSRRSPRQKNGIAHLPAGTTVFLSYFLPELQLPKSQARQLLADLPMQALLLALARALAATGKHPAIVAASPHQQHATSPGRHEL